MSPELVEAYATIERLKRLADEFSTDARNARDEARRAYRAGAEAMREACAMLALTSNAVHGRVDVDALRALPIPEDK